MRMGDILLVQDHSLLGAGIQLFTESGFNHMALVSSETTVIEATPDGVKENIINYERFAVYEVIDITDEQRQKVVDYARKQIGVAYDYLQDAGFALNALRETIGLTRMPHLWDNDKSVICSALGDLSFRDAGIILRSDREAGDLTPTGFVFSDKIRFIENHNLWEL